MTIFMCFIDAGKCFIKKGEIGFCRQSFWSPQTILLVHYVGGTGQLAAASVRVGDPRPRWIWGHQRREGCPNLPHRARFPYEQLLWKGIRLHCSFVACCTYVGHLFSNLYTWNYMLMVLNAQNYKYTVIFFWQWWYLNKIALIQILKLRSL